MANPFYDAKENLEKAQKLIADVINDLDRAMQAYEEAATEPEGRPPSSQLPA